MRPTRTTPTAAYIFGMLTLALLHAFSGLSWPSEWVAIIGAALGLILYGYAFAGVVRGLRWIVSRRFSRIVWSKWAFGFVLGVVTLSAIARALQHYAASR